LPSTFHTITNTSTIQQFSPSLHPTHSNVQARANNSTIHNPHNQKPNPTPTDADTDSEADPIQKLKFGDTQYGPSQVRQQQHREGESDEDAETRRELVNALKPRMPRTSIGLSMYDRATAAPPPRELVYEQEAMRLSGDILICVSRNLITHPWYTLGYGWFGMLGTYLIPKSYHSVIRYSPFLFF